MRYWDGDSYIVDRDMATTLMQIFGGGTDTSACFMNWALLYMCVYPEIQEKVQAEIDLYMKCKCWHFYWHVQSTIFMWQYSSLDIFIFMFYIRIDFLFCLLKEMRDLGVVFSLRHNYAYIDVVFSLYINVGVAFSYACKTNKWVYLFHK